MAEKRVVTRFAPSPTGFMHVGGIRTALYAFLWARKNNGTFILRIEDTDKEREVAGSIDHIKECLKWLGLEWDHGPDIGGPQYPYLQSERLDLYKRYAQILINKGYAYPDPYTEEELEDFRKKAELEKRPFLYRDHRPETFEKWDESKPLRFKTPEIKTSAWNDLVYGDLTAGPEALDDFILIKGDGFPTYNFAHIVDDIEMGVTHVMRGQEFISSTPKFLAIYEALEVKPPLFATLPPILAPDGKKKLGKRDGAKDLLEYRKEGYMPEAMVNFLALLGWNPGDDREIFSKEELIQAFEIERIQKSGAMLNEEKLDWVNNEHIKKLPTEEATAKVLEWLPEDRRNPKIVPLILERISKWSDIQKMSEEGEWDLFFVAPKIDLEKLVFKDSSLEEAKKNITDAISALQDLKDFTKENVKEVLMKLGDNLPKRGALLHPVRYALSGREKSPDPFIISEILGKDETIQRLQKVL
ncbi:MAG TPA: glutamate--tRNA ligase [Candidatus Paceibacterota bacterium]|nr:glutamate--tRNA ligase [Candidatus Paceibacterota bacterium]